MKWLLFAIAITATRDIPGILKANTLCQGHSPRDPIVMKNAAAFPAMSSEDTK